MRIYTLTLNPAYDIHAWTEEFLPQHENLAHITSREAGGKGVNISRALTAGGTPNTALIVLGKDNAEEFREDLARNGLNCHYFEKPGRIRENLTLHCQKTGETRISFSGFSVDETILTDVEAAISADDDTIVTYTGRTPVGIPADAVKAFLRRLQSKGVKLVIDSKSFTLEDLFELKPWLIKPNQEEISAYFGCEIQTPEQAKEAAHRLYEKGIANAMISLGGDGALLACSEGIFAADAPKITPVSTIGAGDSSIAGFLAASAKGAGPLECLKTAVAYGSAACLTEGTQPPAPATIVKFLNP